MSITTLIGSRLVTGIGALALAGSVAGGTVAASSKAKSDNPVRELRHELRDSAKADREEISELRKQLAAEYAKDSPDTARMEAIHEEIEAKKAAISDARFTAFLDMHDELDAKQREKAAKRMAKGKEGKRAKGKRAKGEAKGEAERGGDDRPERPEKSEREAKEDRGSKGKDKGKDRRAG